jgi:hypothetical protein
MPFDSRRPAAAVNLRADTLIDFTRFPAGRPGRHVGGTACRALRALPLALAVWLGCSLAATAQSGITPPVIDGQSVAAGLVPQSAKRRSGPHSCRPVVQQMSAAFVTVVVDPAHAATGPASVPQEAAAVSAPIGTAPPGLSPVEFLEGGPGDSLPPRYSFRDDAAGFLPMLYDDARGVANWNNAAILGGALAASIAIRQDLDGQVRGNTARHPDRWGEGSKTLGRFGEVQYHLPVLFTLYGLSVHRSDDELHDFSTALISAYTINGLSTLAVKGIANTDRPSDVWNGGMFGFPSFHASSTFSMAAVIDEYYGPRAGLPAYALAGLVSWSRIDERDHDLSDVVFGAAMGYVIGHAVAGRHLRCDSRVRLLPYVHPTEGASGLLVDLSF